MRSFNRKDFMKKMSATVALMVVTVTVMIVAAAMAAPAPKRPPQAIPAFPGTLVNAHYVFVTSYDGDQFDPNILPEDRDAIATVQDAIKKWGKFVIVYKPQDADMILMVTSRGSEDILAVYDARGWRREAQYLWRMTGRNGLQPSEAPLITNLEKAFDAAATKK